GDDPLHRDPDHDRGVRRVRVLVDGVPRPVRAVRDRRRAARGAAADGADPDPASVRTGGDAVRSRDLPRSKTAGDLPRDLAGACGLRLAPGRVPVTQLHRLPPPLAALGTTET